MQSNKLFAAKMARKIAEDELDRVSAAYLTSTYGTIDSPNSCTPNGGLDFAKGGDVIYSD